jgi:hypothetical protein
MNQEHNPFRVIAGRLVKSSAKPPASAEEVFANAVAEHLKEHSADGMSLFVFATRIPSGSKLYLYPISAKDAETAFLIAQALHESRGLPPSNEWCLCFSYGDADQGHPVVQ